MKKPTQYTDSEFDRKTVQLLDFMAQHQDRHPQGSKEWAAERHKTIGGSEMATIRGESPYNDIPDLVRTKLGWNPFRGNQYTDWGRVFEPISQRYTELLMKCTIYETGSLPGCVPFTSYSPDGFAVASCDVLRSIQPQHVQHHEITGDAASILFEFKAPITRIPNSEVPQHYVSQPMSGLCHFPFIDIAYFVDMMYRKCSMVQLESPRESDMKYHSRDKFVIDRDPLSYGVIGIYYKKPNRILTPEDYSNVEFLDYDGATPRLIDFGQVTYSVFNTMLNEVSDYDGPLHALYYDPHDTTAPVFANVEHFKHYCVDNDLRAVGVVPYKLFVAQIIPLYRQPDYVSQISDTIVTVINQIQQIKDASDSRKKFDEIFYPNAVPEDDYTDEMEEMLRTYLAK